MSLKLHTENIPGNLHQAATTINCWGWAEYLVHLDHTGGYTVAVFRMPAEKVHEIRRDNVNYAAAVDHDDYLGEPDRFSAFYKGGSVMPSAPISNAPAPLKTDVTSQAPATAPVSIDPPAPPTKATRKKSEQVKAAEVTAAVATEVGQETAPQQFATEGNTVDISGLPAWAR